MMKLYIFAIIVLLTSCGAMDQKEDMAADTVKIVNESSSQGLVTSQEVTETEDPHLKALKVKPLIQKEVKNTQKVNKYCEKIDKRFHHWGWGRSKCKGYQWNHVRNSFLGDPLIWKVFGNESEHKEAHKNMTMILCGVHGDEITPIKFCFDVIDFLSSQDPSEYKDKLVVVAPIVSPDSFFRRRATRTNYRGVDVNRNFPTKDWHAKAIKLWHQRYKKDKRRFPGNKPLSEHETIFQVNLIKRYKPDKIISVHAPLTILDYDGPMDNLISKEGKPKKNVVHHASTLLLKMSEKAKGYKIKNYPFFPGSLGNYAGNERGIPTYTLELPTSDNRKHKVYWKLFKESIHSAIFHDFRTKKKVAENQEKKKQEAPL